jgi:hypothetical protein
VDPADLKLAAEEAARGVEFLQTSEEEAEEATIFPRDPAASQIQSILQRYFLERNLVQRPAAAGVGETVHPISDLSLETSVATPAPRKLFGAMSQTDRALGGMSGRASIPQVAQTPAASRFAGRSGAHDQ